jgi:hypothetical protein
MTHRWMKFWPTDWQSDPALRMCSLAARGLWMEAICLAHAAEPYGHMLVNGKPVTPRQLAVLVGSNAKEIEGLLAELEEAGVFSRTEAGVIYSRRMVRDKAASDAGAAAGKQGGNPALKGKRARVDKGGGNGGGYPEGLSGGITPPHKPEAEAEAEAENNPLTPTADAAGGQDRSSIGKSLPRGTRASGTSPRQIAQAARANAPPPPEPDSPLWPGCKARGVSAADFRQWIAPLIQVVTPDGRPVLIAPKPFHASWVRQNFGVALEHALGQPFEIRATPEAAANG